MNGGAHIPDDELLALLDAELAPDRARAANAHLAVCDQCRARRAGFETAMNGLLGALPNKIDNSAAAHERARKRLLAQMAAAPERRAPARIPWRVLAAAAACLAGVAVSTVTVRADGPRPNATLTPGDARPITSAEACRVSSAVVVVKDIPVETQRQVFQAYGINPAQPGEFEVDYLITPDLGGTASVRNLWPQPYSARWNARQKDQLEERLHEMVCSGRMDVATAQREIAADWIGAYRKFVGRR